MDTTRLTEEEQAILARLERWDRPGCAHTINLGQALTDIRTTLATIAGLRTELEETTEALKKSMCLSDKYAHTCVEQGREIVTLRHEATLNASMLAKQCDLARQAEADLAALRGKLAACEADNKRLVQANEGWHLRVSQLKTSNDAYSEKLEQLEAKLAQAETSYDVMRHLGREYDKYQDAEPKGGA